MFARLCQHHGPGQGHWKSDTRNMKAKRDERNLNKGSSTSAFCLERTRKPRDVPAARGDGKRRHSWSSDSDFQLQERLRDRPSAAGAGSWASSASPSSAASSTSLCSSAPPPQATAAAAFARRDPQRYDSDGGSDSDGWQRDPAEATESGVEDGQALSIWYLNTLDGDPPLPVPDLVGPCRDLLDAGELSSSPAEEEDEDDEDMGQRPSALLSRSRPKLSLTWVLRGQGTAAPVVTATTATADATATATATATVDAATITTTTTTTTVDATTTTATTTTTTTTVTSAVSSDTFLCAVTPSEPTVATKTVPKAVPMAWQQPSRTLSEPSLVLPTEPPVPTADATAAITNSLMIAASRHCSRQPGREKHRHRRTRTPRHKSEKNRKPNRFGYEIQDVDAFLTKASIEKPANIPVVLASPCVLYQTRIGGYQDEVALPLGMVVNAVFKNQAWLYVQTPHGEEGYVNYGACLPLGILPPPQRSHSNSKPPPCWETHTDIFPQPLGNRTDTEKLRDGTRSECGGGGRCYSNGRRGRFVMERDAVSACGERSVDRLYLRAAANAKSKGTTRHTLLVIRSDYNSKGRNTLSVSKGDVVALVSSHLKDWFWVRSRDGNEGFIPSVVAGHGFL